MSACVAVIIQDAHGHDHIFLCFKQSEGKHSKHNVKTWFGQSSTYETSDLVRCATRGGSLHSKRDAAAGAVWHQVPRLNLSHPVASCGLREEYHQYHLNDVESHGLLAEIH